MQLTVFAHFESSHQTQAWCLETLARLAEQGHALRICAIYNGFPLNYDQALAQLTTAYDSIYLPLAVSRRALLSDLLTREWQGELCLWLDGQTLWNPPALASWQAHLCSHPELQGIMPAPASPPDDVAGGPALREAQALAQNPPLTEADFVPCQARDLPACFGWLRASSDSLKTCLEAGASLSLGQDRATLLWAPAAGPEADLTPENSRRLWQALRQGEKQPLAEGLRRSPTSPALYQQALQAEPKQAQHWLEQAFGHGVVSPPLLIQARQYYQQAGQLSAAAACEAIFQGLYSQDSSPSADADREGLTDFLTRYPALPRPARLSVCLIVKDEVLTLERCLSSVTGLADELIVVDTGSSDGTPELAERLGARVIHWAWQNDFAAARNVSLAHASGDWILVLDADQALDPSARNVLWHFLWNPPPGLPRCQVQILNHDEQGHRGLTNYTSQLFPRHPRLRYRHRIHESIVYSGGGHSPAPLIKGLLLQHSGYRREVYDLKQKGPRNLTLLMQQHREEPEAPIWMYYLGDSCLGVGKLAEAIHWFERALARWEQIAAAQGAFPRHIRDDAAVRLLQTQLQLKHYEQVLALARSLPGSLEEIPDYWYFLGQAHLGLDQAEAAAAAFRHCLSFRGREAELMCYIADYIERAPLRQLIRLGRNSLLAGQPQNLSQLKVFADELLRFYPDGNWRGSDDFNLYHLLALLCLAHWQTSQTLPLDWLRPYQHQPEAQLAGQVLLWLTGSSDASWPMMTGLGLGATEIAQVQSSQAICDQFCQELWHQGRLGRSLASILFELAGLRSPSPDTWLRHAQLCHQSHQALRALAVIHDGLRRFPDDQVLQHNLAMLLFETGSAQAALLQLDACLRIWPDFAEARENQARIQAWLAAETRSSA